MQELNQIFQAIKQKKAKLLYPSYQQRLRYLLQIEKLIKENKDKLAQAINQDFGHRSMHETNVLEIFPVLEHIQYIRKNLQKWMRPEKRKVGWMLQLGKAKVYYQPKGVVGIISPWNYPLQLTFIPLIEALAAGNFCLIKPSDLTPAFATLVQTLIANYFPQGEVVTIVGDIEISKAFAKLPFDHLFYTGSTTVGRSIMQAASENLTPVTLELGGKSPTVVADDYPLKEAVEKILHIKLINAGQTCIAPDYVLLPKAKESQFIELAREIFQQLYPDFLNNSDYSSIINEKHWQRVMQLIQEAKQQGAHVIELGQLDHAQRKCPLILVTHCQPNMKIMQEELFAPILPIVTYDHMPEAIQFVNEQPKPLALYLFTHREHLTEMILKETTSGGMTVNGALLHVACHDLPFGGIGPSGMGSYHSKQGFLTFSHARGVFYQGRWNGFTLLRPPYKKMVNLFIKWML